MIAILAFVAKHRALVTWGGTALLILAIAAALYGFGRHAGVAAEAPKVAQAQAEAATAQAETAVTTQAAKAADAAAVSGAHTTAQAEEAARNVQTAPGAPDAVPADVLARWRAGVDGLRAPVAADPDHPPR